MGHGAACVRRDGLCETEGWLQGIRGARKIVEFSQPRSLCEKLGSVNCSFLYILG